MKATIGLEVHAELKTTTKLFCNSKNDPDEKRPNVNICPICMGHPGVLPVINKEAIRLMLRIGLAVGGKLASWSEFDRKNYFYPDIPKGYQISQYKHPLVSGGELAGVAITRVHLEEDTARSTHAGDGSLVDFNRAGVPLMELVTEPVIHDAKLAVRFAKELQLLLRYLRASDADMEKGQMRVEANISVSGSDTFGTKVEVKNLNSFRSVERAIEFEIKRQTKALEKGERVVQETRGWNEAKGETFSQRMKEGSKDYRYFPEPDLSKFEISRIPEFSSDRLLATLPELPERKRARLIEAYAIKSEDAEVFVSDADLGSLFEKAIKGVSDKKLIQLTANYITSDLIGLIRKKDSKATKISPESLAELVLLVAAGKLSSRGAKDTLAALHKEGGSAQGVAEKLDLFQRSETKDMDEIAEAVIQEHAHVAEEYRAGKLSVLQYLVGQGMKQSKGKANPEALKEAFVKKLG